MLAERTCQRNIWGKREIDSIHNDPYPSALSIKEAPGLSKVRKLPSDHRDITPQSPQDKTSTLDRPQSSDKATQHSSSPNLICKVQDWQDWTHTDGGLIKHGEGQDTGSGVYHPCLDVSHYVNPRGVINHEHHLTGRASIYSSRNHSRLLPYSHR